MSDDFDYRLTSGGDVRIKIIRVTEGGLSNRFLGNVMISIKNTRQGTDETVSVKAQYIASSAARNQSNKLSLNKVEAYINHNDKTIFMGPKEGIFFEDALRNKGIASFAMNQLIKVLKLTCPGYNFMPFEFTLSDISPANKERINKYFSRFGMTVIFNEGGEGNTGVVRAGTPLQLVNYYNEDKIKDLNVEEYIFQLVADKSDKDDEIKNLKSELEQLSQDTFGGIPKKQFIKYTLIVCAFTLFFIFYILS